MKTALTLIAGSKLATHLTAAALAFAGTGSLVGGSLSLADHYAANMPAAPAHVAVATSSPTQCPAPQA